MQVVYIISTPSNLHEFFSMIKPKLDTDFGCLSNAKKLQLSLYFIHLHLTSAKRELVTHNGEEIALSTLAIA